MYVCTYVHWCNILVCTYMCCFLYSLLLLDEGGQETAVNGARRGGLHSPKEVSLAAHGSITLPSNSRWMRLSPPTTMQVETDRPTAMSSDNW